MNYRFAEYELALQLKEKGFNEPCLKQSRHTKPCPNKIEGSCPLHNLHCQSPYCETDDSITPIGLPLWQDIIDWFREKKHIMIDIRTFGIGHHVSDYTFIPEVYRSHNELLDNICERIKNPLENGMSYYDARIDGIKKALKLI